MRLGRWLLVIAAVGGVTAVAAAKLGDRFHWRTARPGTPAAPRQAAAQPEEAESPGRTLYRRACVMCHGERGAGTPIGPALADRARDLDAIVRVVQSGVPDVSHELWTPMPPRGDGTFSESESRQVAEYVRSLAR